MSTMNITYQELNRFKAQVRLFIKKDAPEGLDDGYLVRDVLQFVQEHASDLRGKDVFVDYEDELPSVVLAALAVDIRRVGGRMMMYHHLEDTYYPLGEPVYQRVSGS